MQWNFTAPKLWENWGAMVSATFPQSGFAVVTQIPAQETCKSLRNYLAHGSSGVNSETLQGLLQYKK